MQRYAWTPETLRLTGYKAPGSDVQAALHANELPGTALLHFLCERLRRAEAEGSILGDITVVPQANPIGAAQHMFSQHMGRFSTGNRINFNRDFPIPGADGVLAYSAVCTHQGCEVSEWDANGGAMFCFCHFSKFDPLKAGAVTAGPAARALPWLPLKSENGELVVAGAFSSLPGVRKG